MIDKSEKPLIEIKNLVKKFGNFTALNGVSLDVYPGEVHALLGDNGAGKSTLIKVLSGVHPATSGNILVGGKEVNFLTPRQATDSGIGTVYQDLALNALTSVTRNFFLGREIKKGPGPFGIMQMKEMNRITIEEMAKIAPFRPDGFVHMIDFKDELPVSDAYFSLLKDNGVFIVTTGGISLKSMDNLPPFMLDWVDKNFLDSDERAEIIKGYYEEGILLVTGTDAQEGQMNFAEDYFLELQLYKKAGLPNIEILKAATGNARKAFDLPIGTLAVGGKADFVLLDENPLEDISNLTKISQVWKNGKTK